jgi:hypothetical protein
VGLGSSTVVRLEGALTHEVLRYCTAIQGSVLKVVRGTKWDESTHSAGKDSHCFRDADRPQSEACGHQELRGIHRHAKKALNTGFVHGTGANGHGQTRVVCICAAPPNRTKKAYGGAAGLSLSGDTPVNTRLSEHEHYDLDPPTAPRESRTLIGTTPTSAVHSICTGCGQTCGKWAYDALAPLG